MACPTKLPQHRHHYADLSVVLSPAQTHRLADVAEVLLIRLQKTATSLLLANCLSTMALLPKPMAKEQHHLVVHREDADADVEDPLRNQMAEDMW